MALGLGALGLAPDVFWRMSPRELAAAVKGRSGAGGFDRPLARDDLDALMRRFPDHGA